MPHRENGRYPYSLFAFMFRWPEAITVSLFVFLRGQVKRKRQGDTRFAFPLKQE